VGRDVCVEGVAPLTLLFRTAPGSLQSQTHPPVCRRPSLLNARIHILFAVARWSHVFTAFLLPLLYGLWPNVSSVHACGHS